ncbi:MAG: NADH-quinone oxidoreductase subunit H [Campylobacterales bacterium]
MSSWLLILLAPFLGGLLYGLERKVRARMQNRMGPPLLQPFYDALKLIDKRPMIIHSTHALLGVAHFLGVWLAFALLVLGVDLLLVVFFHLMATLFLVLAAQSVRSIYSHIGATRELLTLIAYEPFFVLAAVALQQKSGLTGAPAILENAPSMLTSLSLLLLALLIILPAKLKKSPFDASEAHQEIIGGADIEFSGIFYEALYTARWIEYLFAYGFILLFAGSDWISGLIIAMSAFLLINLIDNAVPRVRWDTMLKIIVATALPLTIANLAWLYWGGAQ